MKNKKEIETGQYNAGHLVISARDSSITGVRLKGQDTVLSSMISMEDSSKIVVYLTRNGHRLCVGEGTPQLLDRHGLTWLNDNVAPLIAMPIKEFKKVEQYKPVPYDANKDGW
jgi:hypothetical protein